MSDVSAALRALARAHGVAPSYLDFDGKRVAARADSLRHFIGHLRDEDLLADADYRGMLRQLAETKRANGLPPVLVAWDGQLPPLWFWTEQLGAAYTVRATSDEGIILWSQHSTGRQKITRRGSKFVRLNLGDMPVLPPGYYELSIIIDDQEVAKSFVISAPEKLKTTAKNWGVFAPVYALRTDAHKAIGDFGDLAHLCQLVRQARGAFVGTLPLLAADYEADLTALSPYAPSSRLFWNEIYLDVDNLPACHPEQSEGSTKWRESGSFANAPVLDGIFDQDAKLVDYAAAYAAKKKMIAAAAQEFFVAGGADDENYQAYRARMPYLDTYATFRGKGDAAAENYHRYAQYACDRQLSAIKEGGGAALYLDYPVGVAGDGFDAMQFHDLFLQGFQVGAPPDLFYDAGQTWGFQALHPQALIADRFKYFRAALAVYFAQARMVRLDHVMGFYRLYCVPDGKKANDGAYIYYPFQALLAILCLEAQRHGAELIGEDLGTVPEAVRTAMDRHGLGRMWLLPFEAKADRAATFAAVPESTIASFNTHDMFPYAAYRTSSDMNELKRLKLIGGKEAEKICTVRDQQWDVWHIGPDGYEELLEDLAGSDARHVMINLEDSWREREPQNIPGTTDQYPNWRHRHRHALEEFTTLPGMQRAFEILQLTRGPTHG